MGDILAKNGLDYSNIPTSLQQVHWRVDKVEEILEKECQERKETDKHIYEKFDKLYNMTIYQLCAIILTLIAVFAVYTKG